MNAYATLEMLKSQSALDIQGAAHDRRLISLLEGVSRQVVLTGMLGAVEGIPVIVSEQMRPADTDGMVTAAGNSTDTGRLLLVNRTQWAQGFRRGPSMDVARDPQRRQTVVTISLRHALTERSGARSSATHTALAYNITHG